MRKNLNKIVAFAICMSVISGSAIPVMADTTSEIQNTSTVNNNVLTLNEAFESAKAKSNTLAILDKNIQLMQTTNSIVDKINDVKKNDNDYIDDKSKLSLDQLEQKRSFQIDKLKYDVTKAYNSMIISSKNINKLKKDIDLQKKEIEQAKLKRSLGLTTDINIDKVELDLQNNQNTLANQENVFNDDKYNFQVLTGKDVNKYVLEDNIKYEKFELSGDLNEYLDSVIEEFTTYSEQLNELEREHWNDDDYKVTNSDVHDAYVKYEETTSANNKLPDLKFDEEDSLETQAEKIKQYIGALNKYQDSTTNYLTVLNNRMTYLQSKSAAETTEIQLNEAKDIYKKNLRTLYTNLINIEKNIELIQAKAELQNKQLRINKVNYDLGLITKLSYDKSVNECETLNNQLLVVIDNHNNLKAQLEKPWLVLQ